jgi:hypothetical protein
MASPNASLIQSWLKEVKKFLPRLMIVDVQKRVSNSRADVYITQVSILQRNGPTRQFLECTRFSYLIADECHSWARGRPEDASERLTFWRNTLIPCADTVYLLSGSVFPYTMPFDLIQTIKSLASPEKRTNWTVVHNNRTVNAYTDTALDHLYEHWLDYDIPYKTELLVPILLCRTAASQIDGIPVMEDYQADMIDQPDGHIDVHSISQETAERNRLVAKLKVENITPTQEITNTQKMDSVDSTSSRT